MNCKAAIPLNERTWPGQAEVPEDLAAALTAAPAAAASTFAALNAQNRYAVLHRVLTAPSPASRANRLATLVGMLERGQTPYPQSAPRTPDAGGTSDGTAGRD